MKRCPQCNRLEPDDSLAFCRADGTALISDSGSVSAEAGTVKFGSAAVSGDIETSVLPQHATDAGISRPTAPTTVLPTQPPAPTHELGKPKQRRFVLVLIALVIVGVAIAGYFYFSRIHKTAIESMAVMPFVNESGNADLEYLSDGMTETLISSLSQLPNLNVKPRSSVFRYKGKETNSQTIGKELNVQAILNGRVVQRGQDLSLFVELIDVALDKVVWSQQYNRKQADLVTLQSEIARDVSSKLKSKLSGADVAKVEKNYTANAEAYQLYLKGRFYWNKRTGESLKQSVEFYNQAIEKDPNYALAYSGLAESYGLFSSYSVDSPQESMPKAKALSYCSGAPVF
jgi:TolB-like protein